MARRPDRRGEVETDDSDGLQGRMGRSGAETERDAVPADGSAPFASLLRRLRLRAALTQEELAERSGLSVEAISALERGFRRHPRTATLALLASALDLTAAE